MSAPLTVIDDWTCPWDCGCTDEPEPSDDSRNPVRCTFCGGLGEPADFSDTVSRATYPEVWE